MIFSGVLSIWFFALYYFYKKDQPKENGEKSDSEDEAPVADAAPRPNVFANARARAEEEKLDRQEMENNQAIREMENLLKDSNRAGLTKKEVQKMEKKLEKAQMAAERLAY